MEINILQEYTSLEEMTVKELLKEWPRYFDTPPKTKSNKKYLVNELIYRVQELAYTPIKEAQHSNHDHG